MHRVTHAPALQTVAILALVSLIGAACGSPSPMSPSPMSPSPASPSPVLPFPASPAPVLPVPALPFPASPSAATLLSTPNAPSLRQPRPSLGWTVTVYYTAVEQFHGGATSRVTGCPQLDCTHGTADIGTYPDSFTRAVHDEGTGRTTAGRYLNWSSDTGYWIDDAPRDASGRPLRPFESAAADPDVLVAATHFTIATCGHDDDGAPVAGEVCAKLRAAHWIITDEFTPGFGGTHHVDAYIGEETGPGFTESAWYATLHSASLVLY